MFPPQERRVGENAAKESFCQPRRDRVEKVDDYAAFGVRYYWIVDPEQQTFETFELGGDGRYVRPLGATGGTLEAIPGCASLTLDLDALWREAEKLGPEQSESN